MRTTRFHVLTLFPEMIVQGLSPSVIGRACEKNIISLNAVNIRDYSTDRHGKTDDYPYGGGAGMLMQAQPVYDAHKAVTGGKKIRTIYVTPQGIPFTQAKAEELAKEGISVEVLDLRTLVPLDWDAIVKSVSKTHNAIVISEEVKRGSYAAEISAQIAEELFDELDAPVERVCGLNIVSPFSPTLEDENFPHPADIVKAVKRVLNR